MSGGQPDDEFGVFETAVLEPSSNRFGSVAADEKDMVQEFGDFSSGPAAVTMDNRVECVSITLNMLSRRPQAS